MSNIATKLTYLNGTKQAIKQAINEDFEVIDDNTTFREYADEISSNNAKYKDLIPKVNVNATNTLDISNSSGLDKALVTQYGNTYQETTTGKNMFNQDNISSIGSEGGTYSNGVITTNQVTSSGTSNFVVYLYDKFVTLTPNTYYLSMDIRIKSGTGSFNKTNDGANDWTVVSKPTLSTTYQRYVYSHTYTSNKNFDRMLIQFSNSTNAVYEITNIMLSTSSDTNFEKYTGGNPAPNPDYPQEIVNISGKSTLKVVGKNLFNKNTITISAYLKEDGTLQTGTGAEYVTSDFIPVQPNTTYYKTQTLSPRTKFYDANKQVLNNTTYQDVSIGGNAGSFTTPSNAYYFRFTGNVNTSTGININTTMVHRGSTASTYEPYKEQSFDLDLKSKNLFDKNNANTINVYINNSNNKLVRTDEGTGCFYIPCEANTTYTVSKTELFGNDRFCVFDTARVPTAGDTVLSFVGTRSGVDTHTSYTITTTATATYLGIFVKAGINPNKTMQEIAETIQVEKNPTATEYEPFYDINLCKIEDYKDRIFRGSGKNLFDISKAERNVYYNYGTQGVVPTVATSDKRITLSPTNSIKVKPNTQYTFTFSSGFRYAVAEMTEDYISLGDSGWKTNTTYTFTTNSTTKYIGFNFSKTDNSTISDNDWNNFVSSQIQLEQGTTASEYEPFGKVWYLEKKIGKVVLNGSETISGQDMGNGTYRFHIRVSDIRSFNSNELPNILSDKFIEIMRTNIYSYTEGITSTTNLLMIYYDMFKNMTEAQFKTWLSTHNTIVYYPLVAPTTTEITESNYPTLYNQLNNIKLFEGVNHINMTNESGLDVEFDITYYKDWKLD